MEPASIFKLANALAITAWVLLIAFPRYRSDKLIIGIFITLLAILYTYIVFTTFKPQDLKSFGELQGVAALFQNKTMLLGGWVHYLAFDLLAGLWIKTNARHHHLNHWLIAPCLLLTFLLGPLGFLTYLVIRTLKTKK